MWARTMVCLGVIGVGCGDDGAAQIDAAVVGPDAFVDPYTEIAHVPVTVNRDLDVLFVVDDSPGMADLQSRFKDAIPAFTARLNGVEGGLPNVHIGVVTSDLGTSAADGTTAAAISSGPGSCSGNGKNGNLQNNGSSIQGTFISDIKNADGTRNSNYTGTLAGTLQGLVLVGEAGCSFGQPLEAARRALVNNPNNTGFRRLNSHLAVVVVTDEDDCSASHSTLFGTAGTSVLGPLTGFRCARWGVTCDVGGTTPNEMAQAGAKSGCHSNETSDYMTHAATYVAPFTAQFGEETFAVIAGPSSPYNVTSTPSVSPACMASATSAYPSPRLASVADQFSFNQVASACVLDLKPTLEGTADNIRHMIGDPCVLRAPSNDCKVIETSAAGTVELPKCTSGAMSPVKPCYELVSDTINCVVEPHITLRIQRSEAPPADTIVSAKCKY